MDNSCCCLTRFDAEYSYNVCEAKLRKHSASIGPRDEEHMNVALGTEEPQRGQNLVLNATETLKHAIQNVPQEQGSSGERRSRGDGTNPETATKRQPSSVRAKGPARQPKKAKQDELLHVARSEILPHFTCPLCKNVLKNTAVLTACMHRFCEGCIHSWFRTLNSCCCPVCEAACPPNGCLPDAVFEQVLVKVLHLEDTIGEEEEERVGLTVPKAATGVSGITKGMMNRRLGSISKPRSCQRVKALRPPAIIFHIAFSLQSKTDSIGPMRRINYVTCPTKKTIQDFKRVLYTYVSHGQQQKQQRADGSKKTAPPRIEGLDRLRIFLALGKNRPAKYISSVHAAIGQSEKDGIANSTSFQSILNAVKAQDQKELRFKIEFAATSSQ